MNLISWSCILLHFMFYVLMRLASSSACRGSDFHSLAGFSCENADEQNVTSPVICLFFFQTVLFCLCTPLLPKACADRRAQTSSRLLRRCLCRGEGSIKRLGCAAYYGHLRALCFILCACLTTRDSCVTSKTLKSKVWPCFVKVQLC